jgi:hypothetical protein
MGGSDDPSNIIKLSIEEHAEAHRILWEEHGHKQDYYAWKGLSGALGKEEIILGLISHPGKSNPFYGRTHTAETKEKMSKIKKETYKGEGNPMYGKKRPDLSTRNKKGHSLEIRKQMSEKRKGRIWVKKGEHQTHIPPEELNNYLVLGWTRGRNRF